METEDVYLRIKYENDVYFEERSFPDMKSEYYPNFTGTDTGTGLRFRVSENAKKLTTTACILENAGKKIVALNFASARNPGGGYVIGANAQEEALCRCSMLYYTIRECKEYYAVNKAHKGADYTDGMIYSSNVPVIRDDSGKQITPVLCDFITCPAVNRRRAKPYIGDDKLNAVMKKRIDGIVALALSKKPELIVFGAFGCGVFGNSRETVYPLFEKAIERYWDGEARIIFADPDYPVL